MTYKPESIKRNLIVKTLPLAKNQQSRVIQQKKPRFYTGLFIKLFKIDMAAGFLLLECSDQFSRLLAWSYDLPL